MAGKLRGHTVYVRLRQDSYDSHGEKTKAFGDFYAVDDVLITPGTTSEAEQTRPDDVEITYTLQFPNTFSGDLRGAQIEVEGEIYAVVGDPHPTPADMCPTRWNMQVEVTRTDG